jgi:2-oxoglutarate dehydrogenase E1 component
MSGQDCKRGTFSQRHAVLVDQETEDEYIPLNNIRDGQAKLEIINSPLSEAGVLGFEYGFSLADPKALVLWEAQFGDFANGAQVIIDQFISSGESKWLRMSGLVMLLPHGFEGQGPEHSSARLERYLQLCAEDNMQVIYPTTPAQMFHMIRRQALRPYRKPLVVMSPKSLLRHKLSVSSLTDLAQGSFRTVIDEVDPLDRKHVTRLLLCTGKVYFDLLEARRERALSECAIVRIEQLYPFPREEILAVVATYPNLEEVVWVQEEPRNMGAWTAMRGRRHLGGCLQPELPLLCVARPYSASPAVGYHALHVKQQQELVDEALNMKRTQAAASGRHKKSA